MFFFVVKHSGRKITVTLLLNEFLASEPLEEAGRTRVFREGLQRRICKEFPVNELHGELVNETSFRGDKRVTTRELPEGSEFRITHLERVSR